MKWIIGWKFPDMYKWHKWGQEWYSKREALAKIKELKEDPNNQNMLFKTVSDKHGNLKSW